MSGLHTLNFEGDPHGDAFDSWRDVFCQHVAACDIEFPNEGPIQYATTVVQMPSMDLVRTKGAALKLVGSGEDEEFALMLACGGPLKIVQGRREFEGAAGGITLIDGAIGGGYLAHGNGGAGAICVNRQALLERRPKAGDFVGLPLAPQPGLSALILSYYNLTLEMAPAADVGTRGAMSNHLLDLVCLAMDMSADILSGTPGLTAIRYAAVVKDIRARLRSPDLDLAGVARRHGMSTRYLQGLFQEHGQTFTGFLREERLRYAYGLLQRTGSHDRTIAEVAFMAGFEDLSHFHRHFRLRFGVTPGEARLRTP